MPRFDGATGGDLAAARALAAGRGGGTVDAVQTACQDACDGCLTRAALAGKDVTVCDALLRDGVLDRGLDMLLVDHVLERLGPVFSSDYLIHGGGGSSCQAPGN